MQPLKLKIAAAISRFKNRCLVVIANVWSRLLFTAVLPNYFKTTGFACGSRCSLKLGTRFRRGRLLVDLLISCSCQRLIFDPCHEKRVTDGYDYCTDKKTNDA